MQTRESAAAGRRCPWVVSRGPHGRSARRWPWGAILASEHVFVRGMKHRSRGILTRHVRDRQEGRRRDLVIGGIVVLARSHCATHGFWAPSSSSRSSSQPRCADRRGPGPPRVPRPARDRAPLRRPGRDRRGHCSGPWCRAPSTRSTRRSATCRDPLRLGDQAEEFDRIRHDILVGLQRRWRTASGRASGRPRGRR